MIGRKDWVLAAHLRQNGRVSLTALSRDTRIPVSTIFDHLRAHSGGLYKRHTALVDFSYLGFSIRAHLLLKVPAEHKFALQGFLASAWNTNTLCKVNNGYDFLVDCVFRDLHELERFVEKLEDDFRVRTPEVHYILEELCRESFLADPSIIDHIINEKPGLVGP